MDNSPEAEASRGRSDDQELFAPRRMTSHDSGYASFDAENYSTQAVNIEHVSPHVGQYSAPADSSTTNRELQVAGRNSTMTAVDSPTPSTSDNNVSYSNQESGDRTMTPASSLSQKTTALTIRPKTRSISETRVEFTTESKVPTAIFIEMPVQQSAEEREEQGRSAMCSIKVQEILDKYWKIHGESIGPSFWRWHQRATEHSVPDWFTWEEVCQKRDKMMDEVFQGNHNPSVWNKLDLPQVSLMREFGKYVLEIHKQGLPKLPDNYEDLIDQVLNPDNVLSTAWDETAKKYKQLINYGLESGCLWQANFKEKMENARKTLSVITCITNASIASADTDNTEQMDSDQLGCSSSCEEGKGILDESNSADPSTSPVRKSRSTGARKSPYSRSGSPNKSARRGFTGKETVKDSGLESNLVTLKRRNTMPIRSSVEELAGLELRSTSPNSDSTSPIGSSEEELGEEGSLASPQSLRGRSPPTPPNNKDSRIGENKEKRNSRARLPSHVRRKIPRAAARNQKLQSNTVQEKKRIHLRTSLQATPQATPRVTPRVREGEENEEILGSEGNEGQ